MMRIMYNHNLYKRLTLIIMILWPGFAFSQEIYVFSNTKSHWQDQLIKEFEIGFDINDKIDENTRIYNAQTFEYELLDIERHGGLIEEIANILELININGRIKFIPLSREHMYVSLVCSDQWFNAINIKFYNSSLASISVAKDLFRSGYLYQGSFSRYYDLDAVDNINNFEDPHVINPLTIKGRDVIEGEPSFKLGIDQFQKRQHIPMIRTVVVPGELGYVYADYSVIPDWFPIMLRTIRSTSLYSKPIDEKENIISEIAPETSLGLIELIEKKGEFAQVLIINTYESGWIYWSDVEVLSIER
ncbi:MAG: hypothetical protein MI717_09960 [Spirochaetales bacterium]|nr:hypothetical protein [Spirochaetales bacterium]